MSKKKQRNGAEETVAKDSAQSGRLNKMNQKDFERELYKLQIELCKLQAWVKAKGLKMIVVFEGRDAAGKGGVLKRITERVSPRVFRVVALPAPTEREKSQMFMQRYIQHFPAAGEIILFDRSWYNRAGVEHVMNFCSQEEYDRFLRVCPIFEREVVESGITLVKYFFDVSQEEQERRFLGRIKDPVKHWKLSPMDVESYRRWWEYTEAYHKMIEATDSDHAPWYVVHSDDKRRSRLNCISHLLSRVPYEEIPFKPPKAQKRDERKTGVPKELKFLHRVPDKY